MINHFVGTGQDELREELSLLVQLYRSFLNFSPRHGRGIMTRYKKTFFLDRAFCNQLGFVAGDEEFIVGLPSQKYDVDVYESFSKVQACSGFLVHPMEYLFLVMHAGNEDARQSNTIAIALPFPRTLHEKLAHIGRVTFVRMNDHNEYLGSHAETGDSFEVEVRKDKTMFWERR